MKTLSYLATLVGITLAFSHQASAQNPVVGPVIEKGDRIAIVGDSITEQKLYSKFIETYLLACTPQWDVQVFQFGWGGERAPGFAARQDNDLAFWNPDLITTCFGMNDGSYRAYDPKIGETYETGMRTIIERFKKDGAKFVIGGPGVVDSETFGKDAPDADKIYNDNLKQLDGIARKLAAEYGYPHADVFDTMMDVMLKAKAAKGETYPVAGGDGVHPGANGHLAMAFAFLKGLGLKGDIAEITLDMSAQKAEASEGHRVVATTADSVTIESGRYPFCFYGNEEDPNGTLGITRFLPFNEELNRFRFTVKNFTGQKAEVQWGDSKKIFTGEQLAKGINLAAEFTEGPFNAPFNATMNAVAQKQAFETPMIKNAITSFRLYETFLPGDPDVASAAAMLTQKLVTKDDELHQSAKATVTPVTHTLTVRTVE